MHNDVCTVRILVDIDSWSVNPSEIIINQWSGLHSPMFP